MEESAGHARVEQVHAPVVRGHVAYRVQAEEVGQVVGVEGVVLLREHQQIRWSAELCIPTGQRHVEGVEDRWGHQGANVRTVTCNTRPRRRVRLVAKGPGEATAQVQRDAAERHLVHRGGEEHGQRLKYQPINS